MFIATAYNKHLAVFDSMVFLHICKVFLSKSNYLKEQVWLEIIVKVSIIIIIILMITINEFYHNPGVVTIKQIIHH